MELNKEAPQKRLLWVIKPIFEGAGGDGAALEVSKRWWRIGSEVGRGLGPEVGKSDS